MGPLELLAVYSVAIIAVSLVGGSLPLVYRWSSSQLHVFTGLSAGFFIAAAFLILIPESVELMDAHEALLLVMVGFVAVLLVERVIMTLHHGEHHHDHDEHDEHEPEVRKECEHTHALTSTTAFIGLAVHGAMDGFALGVAAMVQEEIGAVVFAAILAHKGVEVLALATTFRLAEIPVRRSMLLVGLFTLIVPAAAFAAVPLIGMMESFEVGFPLALAAGTFLYVGIYDLLPEAFHLERRGYRAFLTVVAGIVLMYIVSELAGHIH